MLFRLLTRLISTGLLLLLALSATAQKYRTAAGLRRYVHLGTGNYNHVTARLYTDLGLLTSRDDITREVAEVFNLLTARSEETFRKLMVAPTTMMSGFLRRIDREIEHARAGRPAAIVGTVNCRDLVPA